MHQSLAVRRAGAGLAVVAALAAATSLTAQAATAERSGIRFTTSISAVRGQLPLFRLHGIPAPVAFVEDTVGGARPPVLKGYELIVRDASGHKRGYINGRSGDAAVFPDFTVPASNVDRAPEAAASVVFNRSDVIPKDATQVRLGDETPIFSAKAERAASGKTHVKGGAPSKLFTYVRLARFAAGLPVYGEGSRAIVGVAGDGTIRGFARHWQAATPAGTVAATANTTHIRQAIDAQLIPLQNADTTITVDSVQPVYYDGNAKYLQPAYMFYATLHPRGGKVANDHVRGFVPMGQLVEPMPLLGKQKPSATPTEPQTGTSNKGPISEVAVGQYANRDGTMFDMANAYMNGFDRVPSEPPIVRTEWYWAYPYEVTSWYPTINGVNVAYTQPHGDWYVNTTLSNNQSAWYVYNIGVQGDAGFGAATGGVLATWIIDSCEVAPAWYDLQVTTGNGGNAWNYWWPVFQGLHRVLAFRTQMLLYQDNMNYQIGSDMELGYDAASVFMQDIASYGFGTYLDTHLNQYVHYDRVSEFYDPQNEPETIYDIQGQGPSSSLANTYMGN